MLGHSQVKSCSRIIADTGVRSDQMSRRSLCCRAPSYPSCAFLRLFWRGGTFGKTIGQGLALFLILRRNYVAINIMLLLVLFLNRRNYDWFQHRCKHGNFGVIHSHVHSQCWAVNLILVDDGICCLLNQLRGKRGKYGFTFSHARDHRWVSRQKALARSRIWRL